MPIYEYGCEAGHRFEVTQRMTDPPLTTCQVCELPVSKLISASAISFKGAGWYVTDYSNKMKPPTTEEKTAKPAEPKKDGAEKPAAAASTPPSPPPAAGSTGSGSPPAPASTPST
jgi:putative FmdB family regulatory protein